MNGSQILPDTELRLHLAREGFVPWLKDELARVFPGSQHLVRSPPWIESRLTPAEAAQVPSVAFSAQCLPNAVPVSAASVSAWANAAFQWLLPQLDDGTTLRPWRLHVLSAGDTQDCVPTGRLRLIDQALRQVVKERRRRLWKLLVADPLAPWNDAAGDGTAGSGGESLVQLALATPETGWLSLSHGEERKKLRRCLSRFPAGIIEIANDPSAPSQAHAKLREVQWHLNREILPGETCVDLGGSPGGWSHVALRQGASVVAIDRSPLREDLMSDPKLTFLKQDAFAFAPDTPVDWLLCDVIAFPQRTLELLERWLDHGWCRWFCVTIKFRGADDYPLLETFKAMLSARGSEYSLRQLHSNRNEVTAFGRASPP